MRLLFHIARLEKTNKWPLDLSTVSKAYITNLQLYKKLTPILRSYTSLPLDVVAKNFFIYMDTSDHTIFRVWIHLFILPPMPERRKSHLV